MQTQTGLQQPNCAAKVTGRCNFTPWSQDEYVGELSEFLKSQEKKGNCKQKRCELIVCCVFWENYNKNCLKTIQCAASLREFMKHVMNRTNGLTTRAQEPVALPDVGVFVFQVTVRPDQGLWGEDYLVFGLLELLQQLFGPRGKNHVIAEGGKTCLFYLKSQKVLNL